MTYRRLAFALVFAALWSGLAIMASNVQAQGPTGPKPKVAYSVGGLPFTYQGQLKNASGPINGTCSLQFDLYDAATGGNRLSGPVTGSPDPATVANGYVTVQVTFGAGVFNGDLRYMQVAVKCGSESSYTVLSPRQQITYAPYAMNADTVDGLHASEFTYTAGTGMELDGHQFKVKGSGYQNMLVVAKSGGNFPTITEALNSITDASATNRYLIYVAPGVYNERVTMKEYVDIEGAGESATKITQPGSNDHYTGTVVTANNTELRWLTVENTGGSWVAKAILNNGTTTRLTHLTAVAMGNSIAVIAIQSIYTSTVVISDVTVKATGTNDVAAIGIDASNVTLTNVTGSASGSHLSYGVTPNNSTVTIRNSTFTAEGPGGNYGVYNTSTKDGTFIVKIDTSQLKASTATVQGDSRTTTRVGASRLDGGAVSGSPITCAGVYDENYTFYPSTCP